MKRRIGIIILILIGVAIFLYTQNNWITKSSYRIEFSKLPEKFDGFKVIQLSDLHSKTFGENQKRIVRVLDKSNPDIIAITGDLVDSNHYDEEAGMELVRQAVKIAPVYFVTGNHEWWSGRYDSLEKRLKEAGTIVLRGKSQKIEIEEQNILIAGIDDPAGMQGSYGGPYSVENELKNIASPAEEDTFKILLSHRPERIRDYAGYGFDIVFSGHAHGGQFRIPFIGGLVAPDQGFFPRYTSGVYKESRTSMVVSRGLGNSIIPQRIFNRPEIVEVILKKNSK
ncbi:MAG: metallophosphoesterase [Clostridia bacterium]|nr:metallophosphoesterase [Clostridia bacterium]